MTDVGTTKRRSSRFVCVDLSMVCKFTWESVSISSTNVRLAECGVMNTDIFWTVFC